MLLSLRYLLKVLKDCYSRFITWVRTGRSYPSCLIPKKNFQADIDISSLSANQDLYIVRKFPPGCHNLINEETSTLKANAIDLKEIPNLSMNMLGGSFLIDHCLYHIWGKAAAPWLGGQHVFISDFLNEFRRDTDYCYLAFPVKRLHYISLPFLIDNNKPMQKLMRKIEIETEALGQKLKSKIDGHCYIKHSPNYLNYWHCELKLLDPAGNFISRDGTKTIRDTLSIYVFEHLLSVNFISDITKLEIAKIDSRHFC